MPRYAMRQAVRAAAVELLTDYAAAAAPVVTLQVYAGRPRTIYPPTAFVDAINEPEITYTGLRQRRPQAEIILVHAVYDSLEAVTQADQFTDEFLDWVTDNAAAAGPATLVSISSIEDIPAFVPEWMPEDEQRTYYATRLVLEGLVLDGN
jgi:hypothetical protein